MTHSLKLFLDSTEICDLTDSDHGIVDYTPATPGVDAQSVQETGVFRVYGSTIANFQAHIQELEEFFRLARAGTDGNYGVGRAKVRILQSGYTDSYESEIFDGRVELPGGVLGAAWANRECDVTISWTRKPYWQAVTMASVALSNDNGSGASTIAVYNCNDRTGSSPAKICDWAVVAAAAVAGDLPAPCALVISPVLTESFQELFVTQLVEPLGVTMASPWTVGYYEGETGTGDLSNTAYSGGKAHTYTVPATAAGLDLEWSETDADMLTQFQNFGRFMLRAEFEGLTYKFRPYIKISRRTFYGPSTIISGGTVAYPNGLLMDLGFLRLPPMRKLTEVYNAINFGNVSVGVNISEPVAGGTITVDYLQILGAQRAMRLALGINDLASATQPMVFSNQYDDDQVCVMSGIGATAQAEAIGQAYGNMYLEPGKDQTLFFNWRKVSQQHIAKEYMNISLSYWPRRFTL